MLELEFVIFVFLETLNEVSKEYIKRLNFNIFVCMHLNDKEILKEVVFKTSRSGGKGGQNVNKVSTKVELVFHVQNSLSLSDEQKQMLINKLSGMIDNDGFLHVVSQASRSQLENKKIAIAKFLKLLKSAFIHKKPRKATKPSQTAIEKRIKSKKVVGELKKLRAKIKSD
ncbi:MAG: alternative ribosome rescue aminoacyl-tRNA hydrolase ArfB [Bacteroidia bacterium]